MEVQFDETFGRNRLEEETRKFYIEACQAFGLKPLDYFQVKFSGNTTKAGRAHVDFTPADYALKEAWVELNLALAMDDEENWTEFLQQIIPHEVCHIIAFTFWGTGIEPHGVEWQATMKKFGKNPARTHSMFTAGVSNRSYEWRCINCGQSFFVGKNKHTKLLGGKFTCGVCHSENLGFIKNHAEQIIDANL